MSLPGKWVCEWERARERRFSQTLEPRPLLRSWLIWRTFALLFDIKSHSCTSISLSCMHAQLVKFPFQLVQWGLHFRALNNYQVWVLNPVVVMRASGRWCTMSWSASLFYLQVINVWNCTCAQVQIYDLTWVKVTNSKTPCVSFTCEPTLFWSENLQRTTCLKKKKRNFPVKFNMQLLYNQISV